MSNKNILYFISLLAMLLVLPACNDFLDVNDDPGRISPDEVTLPTLLPSAIRYTATTQFGAAQFGGQYPQYLAGQQISQFTPYGFDQFWRPFYADAFPTLNEIIERGEALGAANYTGIAKVLLAMNVMTAADLYGAAPYSEANQGIDNLYPCYDDMQELYETHIITLINEAINELQAPAPEEPVVATVQNDYIYGGDLAQWLKAAYALRARYHLHLSNRNPQLINEALQDVQMAFTSNDDDLQLIYEQQVPNPWFGFIGNAPNKPMAPSSFLVNLMNGNGYFTGVLDPRISRYMSSDDDGSTYVGVTPGVLIDNSNTNVEITPSTWHATASAPVQMLTYAEMQFILAEATFESNPTLAYEAYLEGIAASMRKVGADEDIDDFLAEPNIGMGAENLTLTDIMLQKYIALYLQIETWTDMRRYQYNTEVYRGLQLPTVNQLIGNNWVQRSNIADDEPGVNTCLPGAENQDVPLWLFE